MAEEKKEKIVVRYPPSPTGPLHIGNIRTFLFNFLFAKKNEGKIILRFEDTDKERSDEKFAKIALADLKELGLTYDEGPFYQSGRTDRYREVIEELIKEGKAYEAEENAAKTGRVVRIKNPGGDIVFNDIIKGEIKIDVSQYGDFVIARSKDDPLYHLTVVVDDFDFGVTHVIRGEDHITSTPRQILIAQAIETPTLKYAHLPLIVGQDGKKLSKRHGAVTYEEFKKQGILPEALLNYLALLGWSAKNDKEFFTLSELISEFDLEKVNNSPAKFDYEKLYAINRQHLLKLSEDKFILLLQEFLPEKLKSFLSLRPDFVQNVFYAEMRERISKFSDISAMFERGEFNFLFEAGEYEEGSLIWKKSDKEKTVEHLKKTLELFEKLPDEFNPKEVKDILWPYAQEHGAGDVLWPVRYALTGAKRSPDPFTVASLLGKKESKERIKKALAKLES